MSPLNPEQMSELRALLDRRLLEHKSDCTSGPNFLNSIAHEFVNRLNSGSGQGMMTATQRVLAEHWWNLARAGVIALVGDEMSGFSSAWITDFGRQVLASSEPSPHDESGYLSSITKRVRRADPVALTYIGEAASAWRLGLHRSSAVMLGCACERLIVMLAEVLAQKNVPPYDAKLTRALGTMTPIASIFDTCREALDSVGLPRNLADGLDRKLVPIFERTRLLRNRSGHPTGERGIVGGGARGPPPRSQFLSLRRRVAGARRNVAVAGDRARTMSFPG